MRKYIVMTFATTPEQKTLVEKWAEEDERSVSYMIRKAIECEAQRRKKTAKEIRQQNH
jgi:predicted transcriptional regulator